MLTATTPALPPRTNIPRPTKKIPKDTPNRVFNKLAWHQNYGTEGVHQKMLSDCIIRWRLLLEEYGPTFVHIKGERNVIADALSRLDARHYQQSLQMIVWLISS